MPDEAGFGGLNGLRVLDFTQGLAGPFGTQILADHGAEVVKIEPVRGEGTRTIGPFHPADSEHRYAGYFHSVNRNKRSLPLDLKRPEAREIVLRLVDQADVVVESFRPGVMDRLGLGYEVLRERNPRLTYAALSGFGDPRTGASPYSSWRSFDVVAQAMGGIAGVTGLTPDQPVKVGPGVGDTVPGMFLAIGILVSVLNARATGKGQFVDVAMVDAILSLSERIVYQRFFEQIVPRPPGNHQPMMAPFGFFPAKDGHVAIGATADGPFGELCVALGAEELLADEAYSTIMKRSKNRARLIEDLGRVTCRFTKAELLEKLGGVIAFGPVYDMDDIAADPHFRARDMLVALDLPGVEAEVRIAGVPVKLSETPGKVERRGPDLGEHTEELLTRAGYDAGDIERLRRAGVVG